MIISKEIVTLQNSYWYRILGQCVVEFKNESMGRPVQDDNRSTRQFQLDFWKWVFSNGKGGIVATHNLIDNHGWDDT